MTSTALEHPRVDVVPQTTEALTLVQQVWHVLRKDARSHRGILMAYLGLSLAEVISTLFAPASLAQWLRLGAQLLASLAVVVSVQAEPPMEGSQWWRAQPISASAMMGAKLTFLLGLLSTAGLAQVLFALYLKSSGDQLLAAGIAPFSGLPFLLAVSLIAAMTGSISRFITAVVSGAAIVLVSLLVMGNLGTPKLAAWAILAVESPAFAPGVSLLALALLQQLYVRRPVRLVSWIGVAAVAILVSANWAAINFPRPARTVTFNAGVPIAAGNVVHHEVAFTAAFAADSTVYLSFVPAGTDTLGNERLVSARISLTLTFPDGHRRTLALHRDNTRTWTRSGLNTRFASGDHEDPLPLVIHEPARADGWQQMQIYDDVPHTVVQIASLSATERDALMRQAATASLDGVADAFQSTVTLLPTLGTREVVIGGGMRASVSRDSAGREKFDGRDWRVHRLRSLVTTRQHPEKDILGHFALADTARRLLINGTIVDVGPTDKPLIFGNAQLQEWRLALLVGERQAELLPEFMPRVRGASADLAIARLDWRWLQRVLFNTKPVAVTTNSSAGIAAEWGRLFAERSSRSVVRIQ